MKKSRIKVIPQTEDYGYDLYNMIENGERQLIEKFVKPDSILFDVGANLGNWSLEALDFEPNAPIYCFEKTHLEELKKNLEKYPQVSIGESVHLDAFCSSNNLDGIHFLRIDAKNWDVLETAPLLLSQKKIVSIQFEYSPLSPTLKKTMELLTGHGYVLFRVFSFGLIHMSHWKEWLSSPRYCNYFAIQRSAISQCEPMQFDPC